MKKATFLFLSILMITSTAYANFNSKEKRQLHEIKNVFIKNQKKLNRCYQDILNKLPDASSFKLNAKIKANKYGYVNKVLFESEGYQVPKKLEKCLASRIKKIKFPKSHNGVTYKFIQPLKFTPWEKLELNAKRRHKKTKRKRKS